MPYEGYADPVTNDGPGFHLDMPVSELTEHNTRAIEASDISSTPLVVETVDRVTHETRPTPTELHGARGLEPPDPKIGRPRFEGWPAEGPRPPRVKQELGEKRR